MIRVRYRADGRNHTMIVAGHAEHSDHGNDIVCAGVSAIVYALMGYLENHKEGPHRVHMAARSGDATIMCLGVESESIKTAYEMAYIGLAQMALRYPDHVMADML